MLLPAASPPPSDRLLYGVEVAWEGLFRGGSDTLDTARARRLLDLMHLVGVTNTRIQISWAEVEATRGRYDWRRIDRLVQLLKARGLVLTCLVDGTPSWAVDPALRQERGEAVSARRAGGLLLPSDFAAESARLLPPSPACLPDLGRFAAALGSRYKATIHRWEFWSHPYQLESPPGRRMSNGAPASDPAAYTRLLRAFASNIKRADPTCLVGVGGLRAADAAGALNRLYAAGAKDTFDAVCLNLAGEDNVAAFDAADSPIRLLGRILSAHGDARKKLWITSWGWATYPEMPTGIVQGEQAKRVTAMLAAMRRDPAIEMACLQTLNDWLPGRSDPLSLVGTGIASRDLLAKPALTAFALAAQHLRVAPDRFRQVGPTTAIPLPMQANPAHVEIDAGDIIGRIPALWRGLHLAGPDRHLLATPQWKDLSAGLAANSAPFVRLNPLRPGLVSLLADGTPVVAWDDADATVKSAARYGANIVVTLTAPPALTDAAWRALVTAVARRYGTAAGYGVVWWELEADRHDVAVRYPAFAAAIHAVLPTTPVGVDLRDEDPLPAARLLVAAALQSHSPLDHVGWCVDPTTALAETAQTLRRLRALLGAHSASSRAILLPDVLPLDSDITHQDPARWAGLADRLLDFAPPDIANALFGSLVASDVMHNGAATAQSDSPTAGWQTFTLINGLIGARLRAVEDDSGVRCLATRTMAGLNILLWPEPSSATSADRPSDRLTLVRLRNLPRNAPGGWRIARRVIAPDLLWGAVAGKSDGGRSGFPLTLAALPAEEADTAAGGDLELPVVVAPSTVTLITLRPHRSPTLKIEVGVSNPVVYGGASQDVLVVVHNPDTKPVRAELLLAGSHPGLVPAEVSRLDLGALPPGSTKRLRYPLRTPPVGRDGDMSAAVHVRVISPGKPQAADEGCRAAVTWKTLAPLAAELETGRVDVGGAELSGVIDVRLTNRTGAPLPVTVDGGRGQVSALLPVGRKATTVQAPVAPTATDPGIYPAMIQVGMRGVPLLTLEAGVGVPVISRHARTPPQIDGDLTGWQDVLPISLGREDQWRGRTWGGPEDLSAAIVTRWDEQNFYFACTVTQSAFTPPSAADEWERRDGVTFGFQRAVAGARMEAEDRYSLALVGGKQPIIRHIGMATAARVAIRRAGNHTYYEAAIPWSELSVSARPNLLLRFAVTVSHGDGQASGAMEWGEGLGIENRPRIYPPLKLEP